MKKTPLLFGAALLFNFYTIGTADSFDYTFDGGQADFNSNFTSGGADEFATLGTPGWQGTGGVSDSARINTGGNSNSALYTAGLATSDGDTWTISAYFRGRPGRDASSQSQETIRLGFNSDATTDSTNLFRFSGLFLATGIQTDNTGNGTLYFRSRDSGGSEAQQFDADTFSIVDNDWYQLSATITKTGTTNLFDAEVSIFNWGSDGVTGGGLVESFSITGYENDTLYSDATIHGGFVAFSQNAVGGARAVDNFESATVPEPSTALFLVLAGFTAVLMRRRASS